MLSVVVWICSCVMHLESKTHISPVLAIESPVAHQWLGHPTRSRRVVASNPIWDSNFSEFPVGSINISSNMCKKIKLIDNDRCSFCQKEEETLTHLFWSCTVTSVFWKEFKNWLLKEEPTWTEASGF